MQFCIRDLDSSDGGTVAATDLAKVSLLELVSVLGVLNDLLQQKTTDVKKCKSSPKTQNAQHYIILSMKQVQQQNHSNTIHQHNLF